MASGAIVRLQILVKMAALLWSGFALLPLLLHAPQQVPLALAIRHGRVEVFHVNSIKILYFFGSGVSESESVVVTS